jgi:cysteine synthase A
MAKVYDSILELIGNTPLLEVHRLEEALGLEARILVKLEYFNPAGSHKDRAALSMIEAAEARGELKPGGTIVDFSSGNTGIAFASIAAAKGYKFLVGLQPGVSEERTKILEAYGSEFFPMPAEALMAGLDKVNELVKQEADAREDAWAAIQLDNPDNPAIHYKTTGPELWDATEGNIDIFIAGTGTGGVINGVGRFLKEKNPDVKILAFEPHIDSVSDPANGKFVEEYQGIHRFKDVPENARAKNVNFDVIDEYPQIKYEEGLEALQLLATLEGVFVGPSSGAALATAIKEARKPENKGKTIVALLPDSGERYLSVDIQKRRPAQDNVEL